MNNLIATLLDCPNLSLRLLDTQGRAVKIVNREQLQRYVSQHQASCQQACNNQACEKHPDRST